MNWLVKKINLLSAGLSSTAKWFITLFNVSCLLSSLSTRSTNLVKNPIMQVVSKKRSRKGNTYTHRDLYFFFFVSCYLIIFVAYPVSLVCYYFLELGGFSDVCGSRAFAVSGGPLGSTSPWLIFSGNSVTFIESLLVSLLFLGVVAFYTLLERKGLAAVQRREGPNVTGPFGLLQAIADGVKLILKDVSASDEADAEAYDIAPVVTFAVSFTCWALIPVGINTGSLVASDFTLILYLCVATLGIFGIVGAGWSTKSKYATLGSLRAISQFIAYEVYFSLLLIPFFLYVGSDLNHVWEKQTTLPFVVPFLPLFVIFFVTMLVETNRAPFDLPEAEAELVAGFNVEYSASAFALFFLGEYNSMIVASALMASLFFGGDCLWLPAGLVDTGVIHNALFYIIKVLGLCFSFVFVRANFPRVRFDQLLLLGWKVCLPVSLSFVWLIFAVKLSI